MLKLIPKKYTENDLENHFEKKTQLFVNYPENYFENDFKESFENDLEYNFENDSKNVFENDF